MSSTSLAGYIVTIGVVVVVLARVVLDEPMAAPKVVGIALTVGGVALLSYAG